MQGSRSEVFQKSIKQKKQWDDGTGKRQDNRKFNANKQARSNGQKSKD